MIILQERTRRAQGSGDIHPSGGARDTAQCPQVILMVRGPYSDHSQNKSKHPSAPSISSKSDQKRHDGRLLDEATLWPAWTEKALLSEALTRPILYGTTVAGSQGEVAGDGDEGWVLRGGGINASWER